MSERDIEKAYEGLKKNAAKLEENSMNCGQDRDSTGMQKCLNTSIHEWDQQLNNTYKTLMRSLPEDARKLLVDSERKWVDFESAELKMDKRIKDPVLRLAEQQDLIKDRAKQLLTRFGGDTPPDESPDLKDLDARLNKTYQSTMKELSPGAQADLKAAEHKWLTFQQAEYKVIDALNPIPNNGESNIHNDMARAEILNDRTNEVAMLKNYPMK